jgi:hypothetical protein
LAYWWLDGYVDFNDAQSLRVKDDLSKLLQWHRSSQLPRYADFLQKLQQHIKTDVAPEQACQWFGEVRGFLDSATAQAEPGVVALAPTLSAEQLRRMENKFAKGNTEWRDQFIDGKTDEIRERRIKQANERSEMLYGRLEDAQKEAIKTVVLQSGFDAQRAYAERLRRQKDMVATLKLMSADAGANASNASTNANPSNANRDSLRALLVRSTQTSPDASYRAYSEASLKEACASFAKVHNSTTAAQRERAFTRLRSYERDFREMAGAKP